MSENRKQIDDWWNSLSEESRDELDAIAHSSILDGIVRYPYWDRALCAELLAWMKLEGDIAEAHGNWLGRLKRRAESRGREWTRDEFLRQCRLTEHGD